MNFDEVFTAGYNDAMIKARTSVINLIRLNPGITATELAQQFFVINTTITKIKFEPNVL